MFVVKKKNQIINWEVCFLVNSHLEFKVTHLGLGIEEMNPLLRVS